MGNSGRTGAFRPKFFLEVVFAHTQIEHHVFNVQLFEQRFVHNSSLSPPPLLVHSSFSPSLLHHLLGPMPTTSSPLARHLSVSLKTQFSLGPSPLTPSHVTSPFSPLTLPLLAPPVPLFSPLSPSPSLPLVSHLVSISISLSLAHPPSCFKSKSQSPSLSLSCRQPPRLIDKGDSLFFSPPPPPGSLCSLCTTHTRLKHSPMSTPAQLRKQIRYVQRYFSCFF